MSIFTVGECRVCHKNCLWLSFVDGELFLLEVCSNECRDTLLEELDKQEKAQAMSDAEIREAE